jgi:hypothetical protein
LELSDATLARPTFVAPSEPTTLWFQLTVDGPGGPLTSDPLEIEVIGQDVPPVAAATSSHETALVGQTVTFDASSSTNAASYAWVQDSGTAVTDLDTDPATFTFTMPTTTEPVSFTVTVTSPTEVTASTTVSVAPVGDPLSVTSAQLRTDKTEWRIAGTATITNNNTVTVYLQNSDGSKGAEVGSATVEAAVAPETGATWSVRSRGGVSPNGATRLIVESSRGGYLDNVSFSTRR